MRREEVVGSGWLAHLQLGPSFAVLAALRANDFPGLLIPCGLPLEGASSILRVWRLWWWSSSLPGPVSFSPLRRPRSFH